MSNYWVNDRAQNNGDHEVHKDGCPYLPLIFSKTYLGYFFLAAQQLLKRGKNTLPLMAVLLVFLSVIPHNSLDLTDFIK